MNWKFVQKYADTAIPFSQNQKFQYQRERLKNFAHDLTLKMHVLLGEMEHDISILRDRGFDRDMQKKLIKLWKDLLMISKGIDMSNPYPAAHDLIKYVNDKETKNIIDNLHFLATHHVKKTNVEFQAGKILRHPEIRSLKLLQKLVEQLEDYVERYPLLEIPSSGVLEEPELLNVKPESPLSAPGPEGITMPRVPMAKKLEAV